MRKVDQIRLANLRLLLRECEEELGSTRGAAALLARKSAVPSAYISQLRNQIPNEGGVPRTIGEDTAKKLESGMMKPHGWMDQDHSIAKSTKEAYLLDLFRILTPSQRERILGTAEEFSELNAAAGGAPGDNTDPPPPRIAPKRH